MSITYHERPGVYVEYDTISRSAGIGTRIAGVAGIGSGSGLYRFTSASTARQAFPDTTPLGKMLQLAFANGAARVMCCPVEVNSLDAYTAALERLVTEGEVNYLALETESTQLLTALGQHLCAMDVPCICFAGPNAPNMDALGIMAQTINCERMVLVGPNVRYAGEESYGGGCLAAAAMAGLLSAQTDPALPLHGAKLLGLDAVKTTLTESEIDAAVRAGVTPLELIGGQVSIIRAVTTRTMTEDVPDDTWRELSTMCILDDVIPTVKNTLAAKFLRRKNTAVTRNAIRSQVAIVLDDRVRREIIESYDALNVEAVEGDPTACRVSFSFAVVHGLCRIHLSIHILV
ncbi:MAG: phage tail sheath protein [Ruminococcaceae bacterium]|nr:phage tail sheath protein [Oscillospiraceae bacterium]